MKNRRGGAADVRIDIEQAIARSKLEPPASFGLPQPAGRRRTLRTTSISVIAGIILGTIVVWSLIRFNPQQPAQPSRFAIILPPTQSLVRAGEDRDIAISPGGRQIVYRRTQGQFAVRSMDQLEGRILAGITEARAPFISPDNQWVGFFTTNGTELKKVPMSELAGRIEAARSGALAPFLRSPRFSGYKHFTISV